MSIPPLSVLFVAGLFGFMVPGATASFADGPHLVWDGLCSCHVATAGFKCNFDRWIRDPSESVVRAKCGAQSNNYGVLTRLQNIELRHKKIRN